MNKSFSANKRQAKFVRFTGTLTVEINGQSIEVSNAFKLQTDLAFSGMTQAEQDTVLNAWKTALAGNADIKFNLNLDAQEIPNKQPTNKEPSVIDRILEEANKPKPGEMADAILRDEEAKSESIDVALEFLGVEALPKSKGV